MAVFPIKIPALRDRKEDIPIMAQYFLERYAGREEKEINAISPDALEMVMAYHWPGNVRELENALERAVILASSSEVVVNDLPPNVRVIGERKVIDTSKTLNSWIEKLEEEALRKALLECEGNVSLTARKLGIGRATIYRKAKKYGLPIVR